MYCTFSSKHCSRQHGQCLIFANSMCRCWLFTSKRKKTKNNLGMSISGPLVESMFLWLKWILQIKPSAKMNWTSQCLFRSSLVWCSTFHYCFSYILTCPWCTLSSLLKIVTFLANGFTLGLSQQSSSERGSGDVCISNAGQSLPSPLCDRSEWEVTVYLRWPHYLCADKCCLFA